MKLKVCGITDLVQARNLEAMQVDYLGFIGYKKSPRYAWDKINPAEVSGLNQIKKVGVFVNETSENMITIIRQAQLDLVQLHGDESMELVKAMAEHIPVIKAIAMNGNREEIQTKINQYASDVTYFLFDTATQNYGGSGQQFNWEILNALDIPKPYFLSGGIAADTKIELNKFQHQPIALDINSKFEIEPGYKNLNKIKEFIAFNELKK